MPFEAVLRRTTMLTIVKDPARLARRILHDLGGESCGRILHVAARGVDGMPEVPVQRGRTEGGPVTGRIAAVIVDSTYSSDLARELDEHVLVDGMAPERLAVDVREIRTRRPDGPGPATTLEQRDLHLTCRRVTTVGSTAFYAPVAGQPPDREDWADSARFILRISS